MSCLAIAISYAFTASFASIALLAIGPYLYPVIEKKLPSKPGRPKWVSRFRRWRKRQNQRLSLLRYQLKRWWYSKGQDIAVILAFYCCLLAISLLILKLLSVSPPALF